MVEHLPPDGALARAARGHSWRTETYHLAEITDLLGRLLVAFVNANRSEKSRAAPYPEPVWRPGDPTPEQKAKRARKAARKARAGYDDIVAQVAPGR